MERSIATKKLGRLLGKSFGYRVDHDAPDAERRADAKAEHQEAVSKRDALDKICKARLEKLLSEDAEYQAANAERKEAVKRVHDLRGKMSRFRFTVGVSTGHFFFIKAQGDSWEEVIAKVEKEKKAA